MWPMIYPFRCPALPYAESCISSYIHRGLNSFCLIIVENPKHILDTVRIRVTKCFLSDKRKKQISVLSKKGRRR